MASRRLTGFLVGAVFGAALSWTGMSSPEVIREALLFEDAYLFLMFASAVVTAFVGLRVLRALRVRAVLTGERVDWSVDRPQRRHVGGSLLFGTGWAIAGACPGPIATQLGQGVAWSLFTLAGVVMGIVLFLRTQTRRAAASG
jgi:uncharacterized membrane protein YedE/YeeE